MRELAVFLLVSLLLVSCAARRTAAYKPYDPDDPVDTDIETCKRSAAEQERSIWGSGFAIAPIRRRANAAVLQRNREVRLWGNPCNATEECVLRMVQQTLC